MKKPTNNSKPTSNNLVTLTERTLRKVAGGGRKAEDAYFVNVGRG